MRTAVEGHQVGIAAPEMTGAGFGQWAQLSGYDQVAGLGTSPLFGNRHLLDEHVQRVVTQGAPPTGPVDGPGVRLLDDWRDVFNWRHSPAPWILVFILAALGLMQFRVMARAGKARGNIALG